ncbi:hypothetical protein BGW38_003050 [Lunasporangiospora selenospora]|uniref:Myb-like DNA-binding domain-containing protein n=1 Tax=Lunasporangiospora selenospora TaxID=979761 RepID=A0A9P6KD47_9FUNG|nr:hypothetical protein BGW38_003050 [Lunasporangiospora selenospora]
MARAVYSLLQQRFITLWISRSQFSCITPGSALITLRHSIPHNSPRHGLHHHYHPGQPSFQVKSFSSTRSCAKSNDKSLIESVCPLTESSTTKPKRARKKSKLEWTEDADAQLLELRVTQNMKWGDIGRHLDREPATCMNRFESTLNLALKDYWTAERDSQLDSLVRASRPWADIAQIMGVHRLACMERWRLRGLEEAAKSGESTIAARKKQTRERQRQRDLEREQTMDQAQHTRQLVLDSESPIDDVYDRQGWNLLLKDEQRYQHYRSWQRKSRTDTFFQLYLMNPGWSAKEETILIQHVLEHGFGQWEMVANEKLKGKFSPKECRTSWKNLDMPVTRTTLPTQSEKASSEQQLQRSSLALSTSIGYRKDMFDEDGDEYGDEDGDDEDDEYDEMYGSEGRWSREEPAEETTEAKDPSTKKSKSSPFVWDKELSVRLQAVIRQAYKSQVVHLEEINWSWISRRIHPEATSRVCKNHWKFLHQPDQVKWSQEDIKRLEEGIRVLGPKKLTAVRAHFLPYMTKDDITRQWYRISDMSTLIDEEGYYRLHRNVQEHTDAAGVVQWLEVEMAMGPGWKKLPCKRVWESSYLNLIRPRLGKDQDTTILPWTPGADDLLLKLVKVVGRDDWYSVANAMQAGRSPWQCRLRWCQLVDSVNLESEDLFFRGHVYC